MKNLSLLGTLCFSLTVALVGCGDDSGNNKNKEDNGISTVETLEDLVHCTQSHYGELVYVEEKEATYECTSNDWVVFEDDEDIKSSSSKVQSSSSTKKDSVDTAPVDTLSVDSVTVSGLAQKGPYVNGSSITIYGLDSLLNTTKEKFSSKITNDSGRYFVKNVSYPSQFVEIETYGFFKNEISGNTTSGVKTKLHAIADISGEKTVYANINLFTELEAARVRFLVKKEGFNIPKAKNHATRELLEIFGDGFSGTSLSTEELNVLTSTDISLADNNQVGAALHAANIILLANNSISKFINVLSDVEDVFAESGSWKDDETRAAVADFLYSKDKLDKFASFRENIENMKIASKIPDFESILRYFWVNEYGLPECNSSNDGIFKKNSNVKSDNYKADFVCSNKRWHVVDAIDAELNFCNNKRNGEYAKSSAGEFYVCQNDSWEEVSEMEYILEELCTKENEDQYRKGDQSYYVCEKNQWKESSEMGFVLKTCADSSQNNYAEYNNNGYVCNKGEWTKCTSNVKGVILGDRVCDDLNDKFMWRGLTEFEEKYGYCTSAIKDSIAWSGAFMNPDTSSIYSEIFENVIPDPNDETGVFLTCNGSTWVRTSGNRYFYGSSCTDGNITSIADTATVLKITGKSKYPSDMVSYLLYLLMMQKFLAFEGDTAYYVTCKNNEWMKITELDYSLKMVCNADLYYKEVSVSEDSVYHCAKYYGGVYGWSLLTSFIDERDGKKYKQTTIGKQTWMAENLAYLYVNEKGDTLSVPNNPNKDVGYIYTKTAAENSCPNNWHLPSSDEWMTLFDTIISFDDLKSYNWGGGSDIFGFGMKGTGYLKYNIKSTVINDPDIAYYFTSDNHYVRLNKSQLTAKSTDIQMYFYGDHMAVRCVK